MVAGTKQALHPWPGAQTQPAAGELGPTAGPGFSPSPVDAKLNPATIQLRVTLSCTVSSDLPKGQMALTHEVV